MEFCDKRKCELCGKEYEGRMRTLYIQHYNNPNKVCCCGECLHKETKKKPHSYTNSIPAYVEGGNVITVLFDRKDDLISYIKNNVFDEAEKEKGEICIGDDGKIVYVDKTRKWWWVSGFSTLRHGDLPNWREKVIEYHGSLDLR